MRAHEMIRQARERAGMTDIEAAARSNLSIYEYGDVESHSDEFISAIPLSAAKAICRGLHLDLAEMIMLEPIGGSDLRPDWPPDLAGLPRTMALRKRRESLGLSIAALADAIGFEDIAIEQAEAEKDYLETLPLQVLADLALRLQLPIGCLIAEPT